MNCFWAKAFNLFLEFFEKRKRGAKI